MERNKLSDWQLADLVMQLNGEINPIGETNIDDIRFNNFITYAGKKTRGFNREDDSSLFSLSKCR